MAVKRPWSEIERELLQEVFWAHTAEEVGRSSDLAAEGFKDSLADVMIVEILSDASERDDLLDLVSKDDLRTLGAIRVFYTSL